MRFLSAAAAALIVGGVLVFTVGAQPQAGKGGAGPNQSDMKKQFAAMVEKNAAPGEQHKLLAALVGDFEQVTEVKVGAADAMKVRAVEKGTWIMGGRFVKVEATSAPDEELKGDRLTVYGFDPVTKKFTLWGVESLGMTAIEATGDYDAATKTFTFEGARDGGPSGKSPFRWTMKIEDGGVIVQEIGMKFSGAPDYMPVVNVKHTPVGKGK